MILLYHFMKVIATKKTHETFLNHADGDLMYYGNIIKADIANGTGIRVSLFVSGCTNRCKGCFQPQTWDFTYGRPYTQQTEDYIIEELAKPYYDGLTILGGEPFELSNQREIVKLIRRVKTELPDRNIWIYTGFTYEKDLVAGGSRYIECTDEILDATDILVDGRFVEEQRNLMLNFRGSSNQRIIDMKQTRANKGNKGNKFPEFPESPAGSIVLSSLNDIK